MCVIQQIHLITTVMEWRYCGILIKKIVNLGETSVLNHIAGDTAKSIKSAIN